MFRILLAAAILSLTMAGLPAHAQAKACKKVDISWTCRVSGSGSGKFPCRGGETEAACCKRWKANPHWCAGRNGGLAKFKCGCPKKGGGARKPGGGKKGGEGRRPGSQTVQTEILQLELRGPAPIPVQPPPQEEEDERKPVPTYDPRFDPPRSRGSDEAAPLGRPPRTDPSVPGVRGGPKLPGLPFGGKRKCACKKVRVKYLCTNGDYGNTERTCRKGESEAACCARYKHRVCSRSRLIAKKWRCKCVEWRNCRTGATFRRR